MESGAGNAKKTVGIAYCPVNVPIFRKDEQCLIEKKTYERSIGYVVKSRIF